MKVKTRGRVQSVGARFAHGQITLDYAAENLCRACASPGGGCQFLGTAATSQVVAEALGMTLTHAALAPSGQPIWLDMARRSARAVLALVANNMRMSDILTDASIRNAMLLHAAFGGSTNLILHLPAVAHAAKLKRPTSQGLGAYESFGPADCRCPAERSSLVPNGAGVSRRRSAGSDAASAPCRFARDQRSHDYG